MQTRDTRKPPADVADSRMRSRYRETAALREYRRQDSPTGRDTFCTFVEVHIADDLVLDLSESPGATPDIGIESHPHLFYVEPTIAVHPVWIATGQDPLSRSVVRESIDLSL